jgi:carbamate kinase
MGRVVVALGGNALNRAGEAGTYEETLGHVRETVGPLLSLLKGGQQLVLTHGNGPQVGALLLQQDATRREVPPLPLDVLGAMSQGWIGYLIQQELATAIHAARLPHQVVVLLTRSEVAAHDPSFHHPTKPVGHFYPENEARLLAKQKGWTFVDDTARGGWRRVVPSPLPRHVIEASWVKDLYSARRVPPFVAILAGGGGVPVVRGSKGRWVGVEAVIDKDRTAALLAHLLGADTLAIVTDVPAVLVGFRTPHPRPLGRVTPAELRRHLQEGEFGEGSMRPKVEAALDFVGRGGARAIITDIRSLPEALKGRAGTVLTGGRTPVVRDPVPPRSINRGPDARRSARTPPHSPGSAGSSARRR